MTGHEPTPPVNIRIKKSNTTNLTQQKYEFKNSIQVIVLPYPMYL